MAAMHAPAPVSGIRTIMGKAAIGLLGSSLVLVTMTAQTLPPVRVLETRTQGPRPADAEIVKTVRANINTEKYREVGVQVIRDSGGKPSHYLVYLHSKTSHRVEFAKIAVDEHFKVLSVQRNYALQEIDLKQQPGGAGARPGR